MCETLKKWQNNWVVCIQGSDVKVQMVAMPTEMGNFPLTLWREHRPTLIPKEYSCQLCLAHRRSQ